MSGSSSEEEPRHCEMFQPLIATPYCNPYRGTAPLVETETTNVGMRIPQSIRRTRYWYMVNAQQNTPPSKVYFAVTVHTCGRVLCRQHARPSRNP